MTHFNPPGYLPRVKSGLPGITVTIRTSYADYECFICYELWDGVDRYNCDFAMVNYDPEKAYHPWGGGFALFYTEARGLHMRRDKKSEPLTPIWEEIIQKVANEIKSQL